MVSHVYSVFGKPYQVIY